MCVVDVTSLKKNERDDVGLQLTEASADRGY